MTQHLERMLELPYPAASGAALIVGAFSGPPGVVVGAVIGGVIGYVASSAHRRPGKKAKEKSENQSRMSEQGR